MGDELVTLVAENKDGHAILLPMDKLGTRPHPDARWDQDKNDWERPSTEIEKWADVAMWRAPEHTDPQHPIVTVKPLTDDPLGVMAMINGQYTGKFYTDPSEVTDDERRGAWADFAVSRLSEAPAEWLQLNVSFENVSRAFTHQLVRTRMATYAQESLRFAVKGNVAESTKLPPSLAGTLSGVEFRERCRQEGVHPHQNRSAEQGWREMWDDALESVDAAYEAMVNSGMPAEDARGLLPTNILTRIHDRIDIKTLRNMAGLRLCTQAQFEWREVFEKLTESMRTCGREEDRWQWELIAESFRPVCFMANRCTMKARADRHCSIRAVVDDFERTGVPSSEWEPKDWNGSTHHPETGTPLIQPSDWMANPKAARIAP